MSVRPESPGNFGMALLEMHPSPRSAGCRVGRQCPDALLIAFTAHSELPVTRAANDTPVFAMFHIRPVDSLELPELAPYRTMRRPAEHVQQRIFVAEGDKVVRRLLETNLTVVSLLVIDRWVDELTPLLQTRREDIPVFTIPREQMEQLVGFRLYQGLMAVAQFPPPLTLDEILAASPKPHLLLALDGLADAENIGVIVRNSVAFGVQMLIAGETSTSPYMRRSVRNSMGTIFKLPIFEPPSLVQTLHELRRRGVRCVAAHGHSQEKTLSQCDLSHGCCIVLGSEAHGISPSVLAACDEAVAIPMANEVDSLNVANAAAVFLFEARRQRGTM